MASAAHTFLIWQVPLQPWYMSTVVMMAVGGVLPFGAVFIELFFIMSSVWLQA